jgi:hypothetical protein
MTCEDRRDAIFLYAAGELEPGEVEVMRAHLATGCPRCAGVLAEAEAVLASVSLALLPVTPDSAVKQKLMVRVTASPSSAGSANAGRSVPSRPATGSGSLAPVPGRRGRFTLGSLVSYSGLAAAVAAVVTGVAVWQNARGKIEVLTAEREILYAERLQLVSLAGEGGAAGRVYWDLDRGTWRVVMFHLKPLPAGKVYQLWAIPDGVGAAPIPMDTFTVEANGNATFTQSVPKTAGALKVAAVTAEPIGGSKSPTMPIVLAGEVK